MNDGLIPRRYALALYKFAKDRGNTAAVYDEMKQVAASFESNPELSKVMANPFVSREDKEKLLLAAAGGALEDDYKSFVKLILDSKREEYAFHMALAYRDIYRKENHIAQVSVTSAVKLDEAQTEKVTSLVRKAFPDMTLEFGFNIDPEIIGGFIITVNSTRMDASVSNELQQLRQTLLSSN